MTPEANSLPLAEYGTPGPLRDALVAAILSGKKTATTSLVADYEKYGDTLPAVGERETVIDSQNQPVCITETVEVSICPAREVTDAFAQAEGEGYTNYEEWWQAHQNFWEGQEPATAEATLTEDVLVVCQRFKVVRRLLQK
ncbi:ASCH domain-containing protein [Rothia nasisuis]|uniref:ASCH domain-containing protein n=1 Tax=Rothia nasisuis TaxID=2109647 RepID=UPI001F465E4F|nr:ASCH domain-containing protein [Rothia nasisuis]